MSTDRRTRIIVSASVPNPNIPIRKGEEFRLQFEAILKDSHLDYIEIRDAQNGFIVVMDAMQAKSLGEFMRDHVMGNLGQEQEMPT